MVAHGQSAQRGGSGPGGHGNAHRGIAAEHLGGFDRGQPRQQILERLTRPGSRFADHQCGARQLLQTDLPLMGGPRVAGSHHDHQLVFPHHHGVESYRNVRSLHKTQLEGPVLKFVQNPRRIQDGHIDTDVGQPSS